MIIKMCPWMRITSHKAWEKIKEKTGLIGIQITIEKKIPVAAGLAGVVAMEGQSLRA